MRTIKLFPLLFFVTCFSFGQKIKINTKERKVIMDQKDYFESYIDDKKDTLTRAFLGAVKKVDNSGPTLKLYGFAPKKESDYSSTFKYYHSKMGRNYYLVELMRTEGKIFALTEGSSIFTHSGVGLLGKLMYVVRSASIMTIPYKIRPGSSSSNLNRITTSGITNAAINLDLARYRIERYLGSGKQQRWRGSIGVMISPGVEEFPDSQRRGFDDDAQGSQKELFVSSGFTLNVSINDVAFSFIPFGWDHATSTIGKSWNYAGRRWWGFGIGLSPKFLNPASN